MANIKITNIGNENVIVYDKTGTGSLEVLDGREFIKVGESRTLDIVNTDILIIKQRNQL